MVDSVVNVARLDVIRGGDARSVAVTLVELPDQRVAQAPAPRVAPRAPQAPGASSDPGATRWRREEIIVHPDGRVERRQSSSDDPQPQP